jgi:hypothetical protein
MRNLIRFLIAAQIATALLFVAPAWFRSTAEFLPSLRRTDEARKETVYGPFYRTMTEYLKRIPADENAVILTPPRDYAHYFWVLNYYFLPRRIYALPDSLLADDSLTIRLRIRHSIFTRSDGFFFDRFPPLSVPGQK